MDSALREVSRSSRFHGAVQAAMEVARQIVGPRTFLVCHIDGRRCTILHVLNAGDHKVTEREIALDDTYCRYVSSGSRETIFIPDTRSNPDYPEIESSQIRGFVGAPIVLGDGRLFGSFCAVDTEPMELNGDQIAAMTSLATLISHAVDAERMSTHDWLTGLYNKALFDDHLKVELARARRNGTMLAVVTIEVDRSALPHNSKGDDVGDHILASIGLRLKSSVRCGDTAARVAPGEFALVLPDIREMVNAIRVTVAVLESIQDPIRVAGDEFVVTASLGVSVYPVHGRTPQELLDHAHAAMHAVKEAGGGMFRMAPYDEGPDPLDASLVRPWLRVVPMTDE